MPKEWFWFASDWIRKWRECSGTIVDSSEVKPMQSRITLVYSQLEIVLEGKPWCFCFVCCRCVWTFCCALLHVQQDNYFGVRWISIQDSLSRRFRWALLLWSDIKEMEHFAAYAVQWGKTCEIQITMSFVRKKILDKSYSNEKSF